MFNREAFLSLFQTEKDWREFFKMVFEEKLASLNDHDGLLEYEKRELTAIFFRMSSTRYEAEGEAAKYWLKTPESRSYERELVERAMQDVSDYDRWLDRKYADRKLIHTGWNPYGEFQKPETTAGGNIKFINDDIDAIAYIA